MNSTTIKQSLAVIFTLVFMLTSCIPAIGENNSAVDDLASSYVYISKTYEFSEPVITEEGEYIYVSLDESDLNMVVPEYPVLPVNLTVMEFPLGTDVSYVYYYHSEPEIINLTQPLAFSLASPPDNMENYEPQSLDDVEIEFGFDSYPDDWISYHTGGGLSKGEHTTFLTLRVYPVRYFPSENQLQFIRNITVYILGYLPSEPIVPEHSTYDLLIIAPKTFENELQPLVRHKENMGVSTKLETLDKIYEEMYWQGRDCQEKIKYYIKDALENWGIKYVLLVGGMKGQTFSWNVPVRYSHIVPWDDQEYAEMSFISDLYYADIYDSVGEFSSWDSNGDDVFSEWMGTFKEEMDLYPDVYLGRLACRNAMEVRIMVNKIINYETETSGQSWFNNFVVVAGDSYNDDSGFNEGELIGEKSIQNMPGFTPVPVYASEQDISRGTVKAAMDPGCGFVYFCGHGSAASWSTHFPPDGTEWTTGFDNDDMPFLRNRNKLPVVIVGGCHNAQFNVTLANMIRGIRENGLKYFSMKQPYGEFWYNEWVPNCWAWKLTSLANRGAIATIANTGLGTHGIEDMDNNGVADYLEVLDGWLELRFFELFAKENIDILGEDHGEALTGYLHKFLGNEDKMDVKMVQQWELLGDPSLKMGGYD